MLLCQFYDDPTMQGHTKFANDSEAVDVGVASAADSITFEPMSTGERHTCSSKIAVFLIRHVRIGVIIVSIHENSIGAH